MSSPTGINIPARPVLSPRPSSERDFRRPSIPSAHDNGLTQPGGFHATSLAVSAARRFTTAAGDAPPLQGSAVDLSGTLSPRSAPQAYWQPFASSASPAGSPKVHFPGTLDPPGPSPGATGGGMHGPTEGAGSRRRSSAGAKYKWLSGGGGTGDEPGVDVRSQRDEDSYSHLRAEAQITVVDYSSDPDADDTNVRVEFKGSRLQEWLTGSHGKRKVGEDGRPVGVRWIHVEGLNWEVIKTLTLQFNLHPLAVEDALRSSGSPRSKLDFYKTHLYLQLLVQHLHPSDEALLSAAADEMGPVRTDIQGDLESGHKVHPSQVGSPQRPKGLLNKLRRRTSLMRLPEGVEGVFEPTLSNTRTQQQQGSSPYEKQAHRMVVDQMSAKYMVPVRRGIMSVFLTRDGTLISLTSQKHSREVLDHIYDRLEDEHSLLRRSGDAGMLVQAMLDVVVDLAIEAFEAEILKLESSVLVDPQVEIVRHLHVLSSQLIRIRRSLSPLLHVCYIVRDQDLQRTLAAASLMSPQDKARSASGVAAADGGGDDGRDGHDDHMSRPHRDAHGMASTSSLSLPTPYAEKGMHNPLLAHLMAGGGGATPTNGTSTPVPGMHGGPGAALALGFFSPMTKVYVGDVIDHLELIVSSMDQFVATCDHLTDYVFTNASMERLSVVTVLFLPLTFIASYFGMNFEIFPEISYNVTYFWKIAAPCTIGFFLIFSYGYLRAFAQTLFRRIARWRRTRAIVAKGKSE